MIVRCEQCGTRYRIDEAKLKPGVIRLTCRSCGDAIVIRRGRRGGEPRVPASAAGTAAEDPGAPEPEKVRFGLFPKLTLLMLTVCMIPLCFFWVVASREADARIRQDAEDLMARTAEGLMNHVDEWLDKNLLVLKTAARLADTASMDRRRQEAVLRAILGECPWMQRVFTVGPDGKNVAGNDGGQPRDHSDRPYYRDIMAGNPFSWERLAGENPKKPAFVLAVPVLREGSLVGLLAAAATAGDMSKRVAAWKNGETGHAFLVDGRGTVVAHRNETFVVDRKNMDAHPLVSAFRRNPHPRALGFEDADGHASRGYILGNRHGWALAVVQRNHEVFAGLERIRNLAVTLSIVTACFVTLIAWVTARAVVTPVARLTDAAERMSLGQLDVEIDAKGRDEIGQLARALARVQTSLRLALERLRR